MKKLILVLSLLGLSACTVVSPGEVGVRFNFGKASSETLSQGTHIWIPFIAGSKIVNVQTHPFEQTLSSGTKDQQEVTTRITVNMGVSPDKVLHVVTEYGDENGALARVSSVISDSVNAVISKFSAEEVLTKRAEVKTQVEALVRERVSAYGVHVQDVSLTDMQYSKEYAAAVERKQVAEQAAKQAEYETIKARQDAKSKIEAAEGDAQALLRNARAEAEANALKLKTLTPELIEYEKVQKWDGVLPQVQGSGSMMLNFTPGKKSNKEE